MGGGEGMGGHEGVNQMKLGRRARFVGRGRERVLWLLGAALLIAVLWAIAPVLGWPLWVRAVLSGLAAAAAVTVPGLRARVGPDDTRALLRKRGVAISGGGDWRPPPVRDVWLGRLRVDAPPGRC